VCTPLVLGVMRHELAHALVGPEEEHGPVWVAAATRIETPAGWVGPGT
jgi:hypothetical protein